ALNETRVDLCFLSYSHLSQLAMQVAAEFRDRANIEIVDYTFESALEQARKRVGAVDAFVSAGSNAAILRGALDTPVATIKVTGYDILVALRNARQLSRRVGIITYGDTIAELDAVKGLLDIEIV
ncbi:MAG TPA: PrpR N-terminal domain-containing protein, partial [Rhodocyclaceae bacterium]|nr:PrpR N-terminal domain-containing protein [Rhodocyclaceae bacterium]